MRMSCEPEPEVAVSGWNEVGARVGAGVVVLVLVDVDVDEDEEQGPALQTYDSYVSGHGSPPTPGSLRTTRWRCMSPPPHSAEHGQIQPTAEYVGVGTWP